MGSISIRVVVIALFGLAWMPIGCGDDTAGGEDAGYDAGTDAGQDAGQDAEDGGQPDAGGDDAVDAGPDAFDGTDAGSDTGSECGNGVAEAGEECDGLDFGGASCEDYGLVSGKLTCTPGCLIDNSGCAECGDGACEPGESVDSCPAECGVVSISAGPAHTCAVLRDGSVVCFGAREGHRLGGAGDTRVPVWVPGIAGALQVACGESHNCVLLDSEQVYCWGRNGFGETGTGELSREVFPPQLVPGLPPVAAIAAGAHHSCATAVNGAVYCWGRGDHGNLGNGHFNLRTATAVPVQGIADSESLHAGRHHTCSMGDHLWCWGHNDHGQIGTNSTVWQNTAHDLSNTAFGVGVGYRHTCATFLRPSMPPIFSGLFCWGSNAYGQLGAPPTSNWLGPQRIAATNSIHIGGGRAHTCVVDVLNPGVPTCWGGNDFGQLGDGTQDSRYEPAPVSGITNSTEITVGQEHACVLLEDQTVRCWGRNHKGQLGDGSPASLSTTPVEPLGL